MRFIASLRVGAGKLHVATSKDAALALAIAMPEAKVSSLPSTSRGEIAKLNAEVARTLGLTLPQAFLVRADRVIQ